jgi:hypothetical protein
MRLNLDDQQGLAVRADELEERGDPRAALIRAQLAGHDGAAIITEHWREWVGSLEPKHTLLRWKGGHLEEVAWRAAPDDWSVAELIDRDAAQGLRRVAAGTEHSLAALERAPALRDLVCFGGAQSLAGRTLASVEKLTVHGADDGDALAAVRLPGLRALHTRCSGNEERFLRAMSRASWWSTVGSWSHRPQSIDGLLALLVVQPMLDRGGRGLRLLCEQPVFDAVPDALRRALPQAAIVLLPTPKRPFDPEDYEGPVSLEICPLAAPMNYRELPAATTSQEPNPQDYDTPRSTTVGSNVPLHEFSSCAWCGQSKTRGVFKTSSTLYSHFETTWFRTWEYECLDCGLFNHVRSMHTR